MVSSRPDRHRRRRAHPHARKSPRGNEQGPPVLATSQVAVDASTRLVIAVDDLHPGNPNDTVVYRNSDIDQKLAGLPPRHPHLHTVLAETLAAS